MRNGVGMDLAGTPGPAVDIAGLAAEHAELLPERMTLASIDNGRSYGTGNNAPVNSPGSNNVVSGYSSIAQTIGSGGSLVETIITGDTFINQW